ncbi:GLUTAREDOXIN DOMAIN-CONTAINING CYSTEINE-RICH PROTEIN CG12206-RELATED [Salix koriyanagi]|uniref:GLUTAREDOXIN DOMAIN-CONTAINING CYSTEINE-RICH PROTEIN CG12206-RELATED n=1 Tax=Salix koriyanagi TaxID=2511006 RepID=A0A9Q1AMM8_9ROSI|nr:GLUTAREDOXIN DOMAIN-CONTAINING CYSTEINE-RICH PROTEIN CG12206-RELATED [Salix koriyanagi]
MGCVSSNLLNNEDEFAQLGSSALSHHIVSLTSTTYGLLNLDPLPPPTPPPQTTTTPPTPSPRFTLGSIFPTPLTEPKSKPEIIDSWELMSGLDTDSFRFLSHYQERPSKLPFFILFQETSRNALHLAKKIPTQIFFRRIDP